MIIQPLVGRAGGYGMVNIPPPMHINCKKGRITTNKTRREGKEHLASWITQHKAELLNGNRYRYKLRPIYTQQNWSGLAAHLHGQCAWSGLIAHRYAHNLDSTHIRMLCSRSRHGQTISNEVSLLSLKVASCLVRSLVEAIVSTCEHSDRNVGLACAEGKVNTHMYVNEISYSSRSYYIIGVCTGVYCTPEVWKMYRYTHTLWDAM